MSTQQLSATDQQRDLGVIITRLQMTETNRKAAQLPTEYWSLLPEISSTKIKKSFSHYTNVLHVHISNVQ